MRNTITMLNNKGSVRFDKLKQGQMFMFCDPWIPENVYMKTNHLGTAIHLNTGITYSIECERQVVPLHRHQPITITSWSEEVTISL